MSDAVDIGRLIVSTPGTLGGRPRIAGTRIAVDHIAVLWNQGDRAEDIVSSKYSQLGLAEVYAALAYYHANKERIDRSISVENALYEQLRAEQAAARNETAAS